MLQPIARPANYTYGYAWWSDSNGTRSCDPREGVLPQWIWDLLLGEQVLDSPHNIRRYATKGEAMEDLEDVVAGLVGGTIDPHETTT